MATGGSQLTKDQALTIMDEVEAELEKADNASKIEQAKQQVGESADMQLLMQSVLPPVSEVLQPVLDRHNFQPGPMGVVALLTATAQHQDVDEVKQKAEAMRQKFIPEHMLPQVQMLMAMGGGSPPS